MEAFRFSTKGQAKSYIIPTVLSVIIGIFIFLYRHKIKISPSIAYLIAAIISFISLMISIKEASKTFEEIIIDNEKVSFYFSNKLKSKIIIDITEVSLVETESLIKIIEKRRGILIGRVYKNRIENREKLEKLIECFNNNHF